MNPAAQAVLRLARFTPAAVARATRLLTATAAVVAGAALAPAPARGASAGGNGVIAYSGWDHELWTVAPATGAQAVLADVWALGPAWSEDGRRLAFGYFAGRSGTLIGVLPALRPATRPWTYGDIEDLTRPGPPSAEHPLGIAASDADPTWAPGGRRVAYRTTDTGDLVVLNPGASKRVIADRATADGPAWSPDGRLIAFTRCQSPDARCSLWTVTPSGRHPCQVTSDALDARAPAWSPDGRRLAFDAQGAIWVLDPRGRSPARAQRIITDGVRPAWSPDGTQIAFIRGYAVYVARTDEPAAGDHDGPSRRGERDRLAAQVTLARLRVEASRPPRSSRRVRLGSERYQPPVLASTAEVLRVRWLRGLTAIVAVATLAAPAGAVARRRVSRPAASQPLAPQDAVVSPDGRRMVWISRDGRSVWGVRRSRQAGWGSPARLLTVRGSVRHRVFSPDSRRIAFENRRRSGTPLHGFADHGLVTFLLVRERSATPDSQMLARLRPHTSGIWSVLFRPPHLEPFDARAGASRTVATRYMRHAIAS